MPQGGYVFAAGGTGGHILPAVALADAARRRDPAIPILFVGTSRTLERDIVSRSGYAHAELPLAASIGARRHPWRWLRQGWQAVRRARELLLSQRPNVVVGCGGFASVPTVWAAAKLGLPVVLLEQNVLPGRATRWLSRWADVVCLAFDDSRKWLPRRANPVVTGNPVRAAIARLHDQPSPICGSAPPTLVVLGGSLGAASLNRAVCDGLQSNPDAWRKWRFIHQTGSESVEAVQALYRQLGLQAEVAPFVEDVPRVLAGASLVIARAGATTLAELACAGRPSIVAPWKRSADDHQRLNALWYAERGAVLFGDEDLLSRNQAMPTGGPLGRDTLPLWSAVLRLANDSELCLQLSARLRGVAKPRATDVCLEAIEAAIARHRS